MVSSTANHKLNKVLLVYPEFPKNTYWSFHYALDFINKKASMPPLGLITVAALFPSYSEIKLIDLNIEPLKDEDILWADAVFTSTMIVQQNSLDRVIRLCNSLNTPIIAGGPHPTTSHTKIKGADHYILGEVEDHFDVFIRDFETDNAKKIYDFKEKPDITTNILPRFDLLNLNAYGSMAIQYSRGCPFKCEFCDIWKIYGNNPRLKSEQILINELDELKNLGWRGPVFIVDDNFIGNKKRVKNELLPTLLNWQINNNFIYRFFTEASVNIAQDAELLELMRDSGFNEVFLGIETPSVESLKEANKPNNAVADLKQVVSEIQKHGIEVMSGFILGFDNDKEDIFDRQIQFIQETGIPKAMVGLLTALPETDLYHRLNNEGRIREESSGNNTHDLSPNFKTVMDVDKLVAGYKKVLSTIYDKRLKNFFNRSSMLLDNLGPNRHFSRKVNFDDIKIFFRSILSQPLKSYGLNYIKFMIRNFLKNRSNFPEVVRLAIMGHHFKVITQETIKVHKISSQIILIQTTLKNKFNTFSNEIVHNFNEAKPSEYLDNIQSFYNSKTAALQKSIKRIHKDFRIDIEKKLNELESFFYSELAVIRA